MILIGNTVLLAPLAKPAASDGGILYSHKHLDDRMQWWVWKVGPGKRLRNGLILPPEVRPGDRCLCPVDGLGVKHKFDDGWVIVDADLIQLIWK